MKTVKIMLIVPLLVFLSPMITPAVENVPVFTVYELIFKGMNYSSKDNPVKDIELLTTWR